MTRRPALVLAMLEGLEPLAFDDAHRRRIDELADVVDWSPLGTYDDERASELLASAEVILGHWGAPLLDAAALERAPKLRAFVYGAGTVKAAVTPEVFERGILVTSAAVANAVPVAEFALAAILFANKNVFVVRDLVREGAGLEEYPSMRTPGNVGKRVGIVGASHVGRKLIELLSSFDLDVVLFDPFVDADECAALGVEPADLDELFASCDVVSLHAPLLETTIGMIGAAQLAAMPDGAVLVNTARGALIDHEALERELRSGRISAVIDVSDPYEPPPPDSPLLTLPNVFYTPHMAGSTGTELARMADLAVDELERYVTGRPARFAVRAEDIDRIA